MNGAFVLQKGNKRKIKHLWLVNVPVNLALSLASNEIGTDTKKKTGCYFCKSSRCLMKFPQRIYKVLCWSRLSCCVSACLLVLVNPTNVCAVRACVSRKRPRSEHHCPRPDAHLLPHLERPPIWGRRQLARRLPWLLLPLRSRDVRAHILPRAQLFSPGCETWPVLPHVWRYAWAIQP